MEVWRRRCVEVWMCGGMEAWRRGGVEVWRCGSADVVVEVWKCEGRSGGASLEEVCELGGIQFAHHEDVMLPPPAGAQLLERGKHRLSPSGGEGSDQYAHHTRLPRPLHQVVPAHQSLGGRKLYPGEGGRGVVWLVDQHARAWEEHAERGEQRVGFTPHPHESPSLRAQIRLGERTAEPSAQQLPSPVAQRASLHP